MRNIYKLDTGLVESAVLRTPIYTPANVRPTIESTPYIEIIDAPLFGMYTNFIAGTKGTELSVSRDGENFQKALTLNRTVFRIAFSGLDRAKAVQHYNILDNPISIKTKQRLFSVEEKHIDKGFNVFLIRNNAKYEVIAIRDIVGGPTSGYSGNYILRGLCGTDIIDADVAEGWIYTCLIGANFDKSWIDTTIYYKNGNGISQFFNRAYSATNLPYAVNANLARTSTGGIKVNFDVAKSDFYYNAVNGYHRKPFTRTVAWEITLEDLYGEILQVIDTQKDWCIFEDFRQVSNGKISIQATDNLNRTGKLTEVIF